MAYHLRKHGDQVRDDLDAVEQKTIYPDASLATKGLMTPEQVEQLDDNSEVLSNFEIMMICR